MKTSYKGKELTSACRPRLKIVCAYAPYYPRATRGNLIWRPMNRMANSTKRSFTKLHSFLSQVCVSPSVRDVNETLCSLKFGLRAMKVHNVAQVNVEVRWMQELVNPFWGMSGKILDRAYKSRSQIPLSVSLERNCDKKQNSG